MKKMVLCIPCLLFIYLANAQDKTVEELKKEAGRQITKDANDTAHKIWKLGGLLNVNFNQAALSNWAAGGDNSALSLNSLLHLYAFYKKDRNSWDNTLDMAYGFTSTTSLGFRKTDDRFDLVSKYGYQLYKAWYLSFLMNVRTQFSKGYNHPNDTTSILTSDFLSPAYVLLAPGITYMPNNNFSVMLSPATVRWVIVKNDSLSKIGAFGVDTGKHVTTQFGAYATISYMHKISDNATYQGRLDLYSNYLKNPQNISLYMTNLLAVKVAKLVSVTLSVNLIYDDQTKSINSDGTQGGPTLQLQEIMGIGLAWKF
jgi:hypothetical protein